MNPVLKKSFFSYSKQVSSKVNFSTKNKYSSGAVQVLGQEYPTLPVLMNVKKQFPLHYEKNVLFEQGKARKVIVPFDPENSENSIQILFDQLRKDEHLFVLLKHKKEEKENAGLLGSYNQTNPQFAIAALDLIKKGRYDVSGFFALKTDDAVAYKNMILEKLDKAKSQSPKESN